MAFLLGHLALVIGVLAFVATLLARSFARDEPYRRDLSGSLLWLGAYLALRLNALWLESSLPREWHAYLHVAWMLAFAFGTIRVSVATALFVRRRFRKRPSAKIHRDVLDFVLYVLVTIPILRTQLKLDVTTLLGTSAVLSLVLGFALQDTLGNLFAGLTLQFERPFEVGDFIRVGQHEGRVLQIAWRSTRIETVRREVVTLPNSVLAKDALTNFTRGGQPVGVDLRVGTSYAAPPNRVKAEILEALREVAAVVTEPAPLCGVEAYGDSAVQYLVRVHLRDYTALPVARDAILGRLWYRFGRADIEIPFPQRVVTLREPPPPRPPPGEELLAQLELFSPFTVEERRAIAQAARLRHFGHGETIVTEGAPGDTFYVVASGSVGVRAGSPPKEIATLGRGQGFGEMSLLTGEPRAATVAALEDCALLELDRPAFAQHFAAHPERAKELTELLATRKAELAAATTAGGAPGEPRDAGKLFERLRHIFRMR